MEPGLQARMTASPVLWIVILSALIVWMVFGVIGSFVHARSHDQFDDDDHSQGQRSQVDRYLSEDQDDDRYWFVGFYNNPDDLSLYASTSFSRRGVNVGQPLGLAIMIVIILGFAALDVLGILAAGS